MKISRRQAMIAASSLLATGLATRAVARRCQTTVVCEGNSLTSGSAEGNFPRELQSILGGWFRVINVGASGNTTGDLIAQAATQVDPWAHTGASRPILVAWEITNDFYFDAKVEEAVKRFEDYCRARTGFRVIPLTVLPRSEGGTPPEFESMRQEATPSCERSGRASFVMSPRMTSLAAPARRWIPNGMPIACI